LLLPDWQVSDGDSEVRFTGFVLAFRASLTTSDRERLRPAIAEAVARAHCFATRRHWYLLDDIKGTFKAWKAENPDATDEERQREWAAGYKRRYREETNPILRRWGMADWVAKDAGN
jgi:hypothetical protein